MNRKIMLEPHHLSEDDAAAEFLRTGHGWFHTPVVDVGGEPCYLVQIRNPEVLAWLHGIDTQSAPGRPRKGRQAADMAQYDTVRDQLRHHPYAWTDPNFGLWVHLTGILPGPSTPGNLKPCAQAVRCIFKEENHENK